MNVRTVTIALIALPVVAIIGTAVVVREVQPRFADTGSSSVAPVDGNAAATERVVSVATRERGVRHYANVMRRNRNSCDRHGFLADCILHP